MGDDSPTDQELSDSAVQQLRDHAYKVGLTAVVLLLTIATVFYHFVESWSWVDSFYFSSIAITTVGFGDLSPSTDASKLFTVFYIFAGLSLVGLVLNETLRRHSRRRITRHSRDKHQ
jgi:voltage-gated potassium channel